MSLENPKAALVIDFFCTNTNNTVKDISESLEMSESKVNSILEKYLNNKTYNER